MSILVNSLHDNVLSYQNFVLLIFQLHYTLWNTSFFGTARRLRSAGSTKAPEVLLPVSRTQVSEEQASVAGSSSFGMEPSVAGPVRFSRGFVHCQCTNEF